MRGTGLTPVNSREGSRGLRRPLVGYARGKAPAEIFKLTHSF